MSKDHIAEADIATYRRVGTTMLGGLWISIGVMIIGVVVSMFAHTGLSEHVAPISGVASGLTHEHARAILSLGILLLFATPLAAILVALAEFVRHRDWPFVSVGVALILIVGAGLALALR
jgi:uncharacterized membrane protein